MGRPERSPESVLTRTLFMPRLGMSGPLGGRHQGCQAAESRAHSRTSPRALPSLAALGGWARTGWPGLPQSALQVPGLSSCAQIPPSHVASQSHTLLLIPQSRKLGRRRHPNQRCPSPGQDCVKGLGLPATGPGCQVPPPGPELV